MEEKKLEDEDHGYHLFPERHSGEGKKGLLAKSLFTFNHKCQVMLRIALDTSPYAKLLMDAMKQSGCTVYKDRHFSCEECDGSVSGGFDAATSEIVLCQNNIHQQSHMNRVVTHELIHAFDHCRAHVDWFNSVRHLACSEIRAANLSGDCSLGNELTRFKFGVKQHHQVRYYIHVHIYLRVFYNINSTHTFYYGLKILNALNASAIHFIMLGNI
ncbi:hypothetical protein FKM82_012658 [Ascaphus truei]